MTVMVLTFVLALVIGVPVAFALGLAAVAFITWSGALPLQIIPTIMFGAMDSFPLMAIPFFILAGELMSRSGIMPNLMAFANSMVGHLRGGLAHVNVSSSMLFSGVTGVAIADTAAVGSALIPSMIRQGYSPAFAAAITASSSVMGAIIPPSVGMLIIAFIYGGQVSITTLFLAGATPGVLIGLSMMAYVALVGRRRGFPVSDEGFSVWNVLSHLRGAALGLAVPVIVLGGIIGGIFTATEAGAVAVAYALIVGVFVVRTLGLSDLRGALLASAKTSAIVFLLMGTARVVGWILVSQGVPQALGGQIQEFTQSPAMLLLLIVLLFFLLGFVMEGVAAMIVLVPIIAPIATLYGLDPHHLCVVIVMTVQLALITPPVALGLFIVSPLANCPMEKIIPEVIPFLLLIIAVILLVVFLPSVAMWLPDARG